MMKRMRKVFVLAIAIQLVCFCTLMFGCDNTSGVVPPEEKPKVTSVEFINTETTIGVGELALKAQVFPTKAEQGVTYELSQTVTGVEIVGATLKVSESASHGAKVVVKVVSKDDATKFATKEFTIDNLLNIPITSITINNTKLENGAGTFKIIATILPANASQEIVYTLKSPVSGISISGDTVTIDLSASDKAQFTVVATSTFDSTKKAEKTFVVYNPYEAFGGTSEFVEAGVEYTFFTVDNKTTKKVFVGDDEQLELAAANKFTPTANIYKIVYTNTELGDFVYTLIADTAANMVDFDVTKVGQPTYEPYSSTGTVVKDETKKIANKATYKFSGECNKPEFNEYIGFSVPSGIYNNLANDETIAVTYYMFNSSAEDIIFKAEAESPTGFITLKKGEWTRVAVMGGTFNYYADNHGLNGCKMSSGYRYGNEWIFRFHFDVRTVQSYSINIAMLVVKGEETTPFLPIEGYGEPNAAGLVSVPNYGDSWKIFKNGVEDTTLANATEFTATDYGEYKITYTKQANGIAITGDYFVYHEDPTKYKEIGTDKLTEHGNGYNFPTNFELSEEKKIVNNKTLKVSCATGEYSAFVWSSGIYNKFETPTSGITLYVFNPNDFIMKIGMAGGGPRTELKAGKWTRLTMDGPTMNWWNNAHGSVGERNSFYFTNDNECCFRFMLQSTNPAVAATVYMSMLISEGTPNTPIITLTARDTFVAKGSTVNIEQPHSAQWTVSLNDVIIPTLNNAKSFVASEFGTYTVNYTKSTATASVTYTSVDHSAATRIEAASGEYIAAANTHHITGTVNSTDLLMGGNTTNFTGVSANANLASSYKSGIKGGTFVKATIYLQNNCVTNAQNLSYMDAPVTSGESVIPYDKAWHKFEVDATKFASDAASGGAASARVRNVDGEWVFTLWFTLPGGGDYNFNMVIFLETTT